MNKIEKRIKIAEACGWTECEYVATIGLAKGYPPEDKPPKYGTYENGMAQIPFFERDLNAMHEAEKVLTDGQLPVYIQNLMCLFCESYKAGWWDVDALEASAIVTTTAEQRAEVFGLTLGLWK